MGREGLKNKVKKNKLNLFKDLPKSLDASKRTSLVYLKIRQRPWMPASKNKCNTEIDGHNVFQSQQSTCLENKKENSK